MRITAIETYLVRVAPHVRTWLFVKVSTDAGVHGWGEGTLEGKERVVAAAIDAHTLQHGLIGADPRQIERLWQRQYRHGFWRGGAVLGSAISALDQALWDIKGKLAGLPVYELLGGACRDRIKLAVDAAVIDGTGRRGRAAASRPARLPSSSTPVWRGSRRRCGPVARGPIR